MDRHGGRRPEEELARRALNDVPAYDEEAKERARTHLRQTMALEAPPIEGPTEMRGRPIRWVVLGAAVAAVLTLLAFILPSGHGGPPVTAARELQRMASVASSRPEPAVPAHGRYVINQEELRPVLYRFIGGGEPFTVITWLDVLRSISPDGSGEIQTLVRDARFPSDENRDSWIDAGSPEIPRAGDEETERFGPGELAFYDVESLPTNIDELRRDLRSGRVVDLTPGPDNMLSVIARLLAQPNTTPEVRSALFKLASTLEGVRLIPEATDPLGRPGVGVSLLDETFDSELIVDPATSAVLAIVERPTPEFVEGHLSWIAFVD